MRSMRSLGVAVALLVVTLARAPAAHAEDQPWAAGVSEAQKATAKRLLDAGNLAFVEKKYTEALGSYRDAVAAWDHPAIRFNIVRCLIQLERYVEADENLKKALAYGEAPLEEAVYREAQNYEKLLAKQVVDLDVACTQPGVKVTLDGQPLGDCPLKTARRVTPGRHQVVGVKAGFLTRTEDLVVVGGERRTLDLKLMPLERAAKIEHRWPTWMPWVVFGGGLAVAGIGGLVQLKAVSDMRAYDRDITLSCGAGCTPDQVSDDARARKDLAELESAIGVSVIAVGAATAVTGAVLLYLNRGRTVYPDERAQRVSVQPTSGGAALTFRGSF